MLEREAARGPAHEINFIFMVPSHSRTRAGLAHCMKWWAHWRAELCFVVAGCFHGRDGWSAFHVPSVASRYAVRNPFCGRYSLLILLLVLLSLPCCSGMDCTRAIRARQLPHRLRPFIVAQTANVTDEYRVKCIDSGMDRFTVRAHMSTQREHSTDVHATGVRRHTKHMLE